jgi:hypothetical protein
VAQTAWAAWREETTFAEQLTRDHDLGFSWLAADVMQIGAR